MEKDWTERKDWTAPNAEDFRKAAARLRKDANGDELKLAVADALEHAADHWWDYVNPPLSRVALEVLEG